MANTPQPGEDGFPVAFCSNWDGDRFVIVDPADADMSGWCVATVDIDGRRSLSEFTRNDVWFGGDGGAWNGLGYGPPCKPWSALVDHLNKITAWTPPGDRSTATKELLGAVDIRKYLDEDEIQVYDDDIRMADMHVAEADHRPATS
jgi:hypothetical protein